MGKTKVVLVVVVVVVVIVVVDDGMEELVKRASKSSPSDRAHVD